MAEIIDNWDERLRAQLVRWLEEAYPEEGCGLIVESEGRLEFRGCDNVIERYHELDPEEYPFTAREFYMIDPREFMGVDDRGETLEVIVHSHPDTDDYFSDRDTEAALLPAAEDEPREPSYPGTDYLVVSVRDGRAKSASLYRFDATTERFECVDEVRSLTGDD